MPEVADDDMEDEFETDSDDDMEDEFETDKCLNKPFKDNMQRKYLNWMMTGPFEYTPAGKKKALSKNLVLRWVKQSWEETPEEMVRRSFKTCRISNALNGTEDDAI